MESEAPSTKSTQVLPLIAYDYNIAHMGHNQSIPLVPQSEDNPNLDGSPQELGHSPKGMADNGFWPQATTVDPLEGKANVEQPLLNFSEEKQKEEVKTYQYTEDKQRRESRIHTSLLEKQKLAPIRKEGPLQLLDLPLDNLKDIFKEVTLTNDLVSLALVNSTIHGLVIPLIYSRFDIVWPDINSPAEPRQGVDALTYGLATLVMREDLFEHANHHPHDFSKACGSYSCRHCGSTNYISKDPELRPRIRKTRRGNYYSQFVKNFSLGNGPSKLVKEYHVTKESGKMLGTLVALAIARMPNLESFKWDMPTGILCDIWAALASLGDYQEPKLRNIWVRLYDTNAPLQEALEAPGPSQQPAEGPETSTRTDAETFGVSEVKWCNHHVEKPNFSILPPLKSITVLAIGEVNCLVELSELLYRSVHTLRWLRLGMAPTLHMAGFSREAKEIKQLYAGGVLALLMRNFYDHSFALEVSEMKLSSTRDPKICEMNTAGTLATSSSQASALDENTIDPALLEAKAHSDQKDLLTTVAEPDQGPFEPPSPGQPSLTSSTDKDSLAFKPEHTPALHRKIKEMLDSTIRLKLYNLEIERVALHSRVLRKSIDFTVLTSLTLLQCGDTATLWEELKRNYPPRKPLVSFTPARASTSPKRQPRLRRKPSSESLAGAIEYPLSLKKIHTDLVSKELISFLKTALAPNSLEWMFLQNSCPPPRSTVSLESIYRGPLKRHRASLTKVMIDSAYGKERTRGRSAAARTWMLSREVLTFITSGKMGRLCELAMSIEYKDWHFFLQRLPLIPHVKSIYLPHILDHPSGSSFSCRETALGAVDIVAIRPEVKLTYLAIRETCFEIQERKLKPKVNAQETATNELDTDDDTDGYDLPNEEDVDSEDESINPPPAAPVPEATDSDAEHSPDTEDDYDERSSSSDRRKVKYKLQEILFYDDKVSIFKARHGRL